MKKRTIFSVLIAMMLSLCVASGIFAFADGSDFAPLGTDKLISVTGKHTVTKSIDKSGAVAHKGLFVQPSASSVMRINGVFDGDTELKFHFPQHAGATATHSFGKAIFTITDVIDPNNKFEIRFGEDWSLVTVAVAHNGQFRSTRQWKEGDIYPIYTTDNPSNSYPTASGDNDQISTTIKLKWDGDVLCVYVGGRYNTDGRIIAKFDGTSAVNEAKQEFGLPLMAFDNGYIISMSMPNSGESGEYEGKSRFGYSEILLENITMGGNVTDLSGDTVASEPAWYADYQNVTEINVNDYQSGYYADGDRIPTATYIRPAIGGAVTAVEKVYIKDKNASDDTYAEAGATFTAGGEYTIKYVAVDGASYIGNEITKDFSVMSKGEYYDPSELISVDGATVTSGVTKQYEATCLDNATAEKRIHNGVLVEKSGEVTSFNGNIKGIFGADKSETTVDYTFWGSPNQSNDESGVRMKWGSVVFRIADVQDPSNYIEVEHYKGSGWYPFICVTDKRNGRSETRTTQYWGNHIYGGKESSGESAIGTTFNTGYNPNEQSRIKLVWESDVLVVKGNNFRGDERVLAKFDGTTTIDDTAQTFALPKISFPKGYTISFTSIETDGQVVPILFESIKSGEETLNLGTKYIISENAAKPEWFDAYSEIVEISLEKEVKAVNVFDKDVYIPSATYIRPSVGGAAAAVEKIELQKDGGEFEEVSSGAKRLEKGNYTLRYTAIANGDNVGNTVERNFRVIDEYFDYADMISDADGATVIASADASGSVSHKGLLVRPESEKESYSGKLNGVFTGDSNTIKFNFPGDLHTDGNHYARKIDFTFRFTDAKDPDNYFEVFYFNHGWNNWYNACAVRSKDGQVRMTQDEWIFTAVNDTRILKDDGTYATDNDGKIISLDLHTLPFYGGNDKNSGMLKIVNESGGLTVYVLSSDASKEYVLARFDGTTDIKSETTPKHYNLPKISFENGYIVSFSANAKEDELTAPVLFEEINGVKIADAYKELNSSDFTKYEFVGDASVTTNATRYPVAAKDLGLGAKFYYNITMGGFNANAYHTVYANANDYDLTQIGSQQLSYSYIGQTATQTLVVEDGAPVVTLKGESSVVYRLGGPNATDMSISASDVSAEDELDGPIDNIVITVKAPSESEFTAIELQNGKFVPTELGEYVVRYTATDKGGQSSYADLTIKVVDGALPVITVNGELPTLALLNSEITLPSATATDNGEALDGVVCTVYFGNEAVATNGNKFVAAKVGTYTIKYFVADADGNEALKEFNVTVYADTEKPVIADVEIAGTAKLGDTVTLPTTTATDNVDGNVTVTVKVTFGTEEITVTNGKFVIEKNGTYIITYTATDSSGNVATLEKSIEVSDTSVPKKKGCKSMAANGAAGGAAAVVCLYAAIACFANFKKNKAK